jgi:hypothetical protein
VITGRRQTEWTGATHVHEDGQILVINGKA